MAKKKVSKKKAAPKKKAATKPTLTSVPTYGKRTVVLIEDGKTSKRLVCEQPIQMEMVVATLNDAIELVGSKASPEIVGMQAQVLTADQGELKFKHDGSFTDKILRFGRNKDNGTIIHLELNSGVYMVYLNPTGSDPELAIKGKPAFMGAAEEIVKNIGKKTTARPVQPARDSEFKGTQLTFKGQPLN